MYSPVVLFIAQLAYRLVYYIIAYADVISNNKRTPVKSRIEALYTILNSTLCMCTNISLYITNNYYNFKIYF